MSAFFQNHKNKIIIVLSVLLAVSVAVLGVFLLVTAIKNRAVDITEGRSSHTSVAEIFDEPSSDVPVIAPTEEEPPKPPEIGLVFTSKTNYTTNDSFAVITGTSDPAQPLKMNGAEVTRNSDGSFALEVNLAIGDNRFTFEHKGKTSVCKIHYHYVVIKAYYPYQKQSLESGSAFSAVVLARSGSTVTATFNGETISLKPAPMQEETADGFINYSSSFKLPSGNDRELNLGKVKFTASYNNITEVKSSPDIICKEDMTVAGKSYIAEVIAHAAETFNGSTVDDLSSPLNSYLPKGTVDYCASGITYDAKSDNHYYNLRCGYRVYVDKRNAPDKGKVAVTKRYRGDLPDHNEITVKSFETVGKHTVLTLGTLWKAPFQVDVSPQSYQNPADQNYLISSATYQYVDILFFYATVFEGDIIIPADNKVFSWVQVFNNNNGSHTLRLHLKNPGQFYGWECDYDQNGQLCFYFLNPVNTTAANNKYGTDLTGATILIDAGHGGVDGGAPGRNPSVHPEAERNLLLANKLKAELESIGATVIMTRSGNNSLSADERCRILRQAKPDYAIAIHHNSSASLSPHGFGAYHFGPYSSKAASYVYNHTAASGIYRKTTFEWHYFYLARMTTCPVVLTENGFISNQVDYNGIASDGVNTAKAQAITKGIVEYFANIRQFAAEN